MSFTTANPEIVVRCYETEDRAFGLPRIRINGYDDLLSRSFMGLQVNPRHFDAHIHSRRSDRCEDAIEKERYNAGQYVLGRGKSVTLWIHFVFKPQQTPKVKEKTESSTKRSTASVPEFDRPIGYRRPATHISLFPEPEPSRRRSSPQVQAFPDGRSTDSTPVPQHRTSSNSYLYRPDSSNARTPPWAPNFAPLAVDDRSRDYGRPAPFTHANSLFARGRRPLEYGRAATPLPSDIPLSGSTTSRLPSRTRGRSRATSSRFQELVLPDASENSDSIEVLPKAPRHRNREYIFADTIDRAQAEQSRKDKARQSRQRDEDDSSSLFCTPPRVSRTSVKEDDSLPRFYSSPEPVRRGNLDPLENPRHDPRRKRVVVLSPSPSPVEGVDEVHSPQNPLSPSLQHASSPSPELVYANENARYVATEANRIVAELAERDRREGRRWDESRDLNELLESAGRPDRRSNARRVMEEEEEEEGGGGGGGGRGRWG